MVDYVIMKQMINPLIDMTFDLAFKMFFKENKGLLISILQDFLPLPGKYKIADVTLINAEETPRRLEGKTHQLDLKVQLFKEGEESLEETETVNVEMQTTSSPHFLKRILVYLCRIYSSQLDKGKGYKDLRSVYSLVFTTKNLSVLNAVDEYYHVCDFRRANPPRLQISHDLQFVLVELDKFVKELSDLTNQMEAWCWFLKYSRKIKDKNIATELKEKGDSMGQAIEHLRTLSADDRLREQLEAEQKRRLDQEDSLQVKYDEGRKEGRKEGQIEGEQKGLEKGLEKGRKEGQIEGEQKGLEKGLEKGRKEGQIEGEQKGLEKGRKAVALKLLKKGMEPDFISETTGLSKKEVKYLKD